MIKKHKLSFLATILCLSTIIYSCKKNETTQESLDNSKNKLEIIKPDNLALANNDPGTEIGCYIKLTDDLSAGSTTAGKDYNKCVKNLQPPKDFKDPVVSSPATDVVDDYMLIREVSELATLAGINPNDPLASKVNQMSSFYAPSINLYNIYYDTSLTSEDNLTRLLWHARENGLDSTYYTLGGGTLYPTSNSYFLKALLYARQQTGPTFTISSWIEGGLSGL
ncbi:hypothetical protein [Pedobacter zeae]|uniref:Uncharacterized protein n=1 Tax=Pedobacter zeae TaxID=1737356 RepID=A0A7W6P6E4_9SPHI|nr:hypothetical protein [Pedobacter zeae]MBB4108758.1 hypothetical protein [Pedobacter zeae]GGH08180.1 hypothetical protein GCM10007422_25550 [Pedobacter zeae]